jgi:hypothetical protein
VRLGLVLVGIALLSSADAAPRAGKVVRVERRPSGLTGTPRYCTVSAVDLISYCISEKAPDVGEHLTVIDNHRVLGVIKVTQVTPLPDSCQQNMMWMTQGTLERGDLNNPQGQMIATIDVPVDNRVAKLLNVDKSPGGRPWGTDTIYAIDRNGDGDPDVEFVQFQCDDAGNQSNNPTGTCYEVWATAAGRGLEKIRTEKQKHCYRWIVASCSPPSAARCSRKPRRASRLSIRARIAPRCRRSATSRSIARSTACPASPPIARCLPRTTLGSRR